jgi:phosphonoacetate hydrolase
VLDGDLDRRDSIARWLMTRDEVGMVFTSSDDDVTGIVEGTFSTRLVRLDHARGPDLVYVLRSSTQDDPHGLPGQCSITDGDVPLGGGMHGGLNRHELNTVLMLGGAAFVGKAGISSAPCGIVDIGPTILDLMGVAPGPSMVGTSLLSQARTIPETSVITHNAQLGNFHQQLQTIKRGDHLFPVHGGRV